MACFNPDVSRVRECPHAIIAERYGNGKIYGYRVSCRAKHRQTCPVFSHNCPCLIAEVPA